jgi:hypothetical protein
MLANSLGLQPDGFRGQLRIMHPRLPEWLGQVRVRNLRIGSATVDLEYQRSEQRTLVSVTRQSGTLDVIIQP